MKKNTKRTVKVIYGLIILLICFFVYNFSLVGKDVYIFRYPEWLWGHCKAVIVVWFLFLIMTTIVYRFYNSSIRACFKKALRYMSVIAFIIIVCILAFGINYGLLFHTDKRYPSYPTYDDSDWMNIDVQIPVALSLVEKAGQGTVL